MELRRHDPLAYGMPIHVPPGLTKCNIPDKDWGSSLVVYEICNQIDPGSRSFNFLESRFFHSHEVIQFGVYFEQLLHESMYAKFLAQCLTHTKK